MSNIADIIKYEGDNSTFIWKHPCEDFNALTQLIVHESQEAIFFMNGQALDTFGPGRYTLATQNIPQASKYFKRVADGESPFHCEVYFINKTVQMALKWGTPEKTRYLDPELGFPIEIGAHGSMNLAVTNGRMLLLKLVGTMNGIAWDNADSAAAAASMGNANRNFTNSLTNAFRPMISSRIKTNLSVVIKENHISLFEVDEHLDEIAFTLKSKLDPEFAEYGLAIPDFYVTGIQLPDRNENPVFNDLLESHAYRARTTIEKNKAEFIKSKAQIEAETKASVAQSNIQAEMEIRSAQAQADVQVAGEKAKAVAAETEVSKLEAEKKIIEARAQATAAAAAEAASIRETGLAEAEVLRAKGISERDYIQADVQKAWAQGIGNMGSNGGSGGGSMMNDVVGIGIGLQAAQAVGNQMGGIFSGITGNTAAGGDAAPASKCAKCGADLPANAKFCFTCGEKVVNINDNEMICPSCGEKTPKGKFCIQCGFKFVSACPNCGAEVPAGGKFCLECGNKLS